MGAEVLGPAGHSQPLFGPCGSQLFSGPLNFEPRQTLNIKLCNGCCSKTLHFSLPQSPKDAHAYQFHISQVLLVLC